MTKYVINAIIDVDFKANTPTEATAIFRKFMTECGIVHYAISTVELGEEDD